MALLHQADLSPTKLELLAAWLPTRTWYRSPADAGLERLAWYRFDDPAGEVGIETLLVGTGDRPQWQVPLTYRHAPLDGGEQWLVGTTEHSVLGRRWVYDACGDPVYAAALAGTIFAGTGQAEELLDVDGRLQRREPTMSVRGSGTGAVAVPVVGVLTEVGTGDPTVIRTPALELTVWRTLDGAGEPADPAGGTPLTLTGTWPGQPTPVVLARARRRG